MQFERANPIADETWSLSPPTAARAVKYASVSIAHNVVLVRFPNFAILNSRRDMDEPLDAISFEAFQMVNC